MAATIVKLNKWANSHTNIAMDALRILFGLFIVYKGIFFLNQAEYLTEILTATGTLGAYLILVHYVALAHLCGGFFITIGLITRFASLLQVPILIGAVLVNFIGKMDVSNLIQSSIGLVLSIFFVVYGSGKHSADYSLKLNI